MVDCSNKKLLLEKMNVSIMLTVGPNMRKLNPVIHPYPTVSGYQNATSLNISSLVYNFIKKN